MILLLPGLILLFSFHFYSIIFPGIHSFSIVNVLLYYPHYLSIPFQTIQIFFSISITPIGVAIVSHTPCAVGSIMFGIPLQRPHTHFVAAYADEYQFQPCHVNRTHRKTHYFGYTSTLFEKMLMTYCVDAPDQGKNKIKPHRTLTKVYSLCYVVLCNVL